MHRRINPTDLIREPGTEPLPRPAGPKSYLLKLHKKATKGQLRVLKLLGGHESTMDDLLTADLTETQATRLREQTWMFAVEVQQIARPAARRVEINRGGKPAKQTWGVYTHKKPTKAQADILYLLGADVTDTSVRAYETELTDTQVERLKAEAWVKNVQPSVEFHNCTPPVAVTADFNYSKLDAALTGAVNNRQDPASKSITLTIATHDVPDADQVAFLQALGGVNSPEVKHKTFTAKLSQNDIKALSNQSWVKALRGSQRLKPC